MKRYFFVIVIIIFSLLTLSCSKDNNPIQPDEQPSLKKAWTFLLYDDADFNDAYDPLDDFSTLVSSDTNVNYIVLRDGNNSKANYYQIGNQHEQILLDSLGEINVGDKSSLENFLNYAKTEFPAERYMIALYDHGGGWLGTCWDVTSHDDNLIPAEINTALTNAGGVDILLFTAPCLMGSIETAYQVRKSTEFYIGSESISGFIFWLGMFDKFDLFLKNNYNISSEEIAKKIILLHDENKDAFGYGSKITMSAVNSKKLTNLIFIFNKVVNYYVDNPDKFKSFNHENVKTEGTDFYDFLGLLQSLYDNETETEIKNDIAETTNYFNACLVAECHGEETIGFTGLNIYFPQWKYDSEVYFSPNGIGLDFKSDCGWGTLVNLSLGKVAPNKSNELPDFIFKMDGKILN